MTPSDETDTGRVEVTQADREAVERVLTSYRNRTITLPDAILALASSNRSEGGGAPAGVRDAGQEALIEQEAIDLIVDLLGTGASQSGTNCRVVEDHLRQFARRLAALTARPDDEWEGPAYEYGVTWGPEEAHPDRHPPTTNAGGEREA